MKSGPYFQLLASNGPVFCAGGDLAEMAAAGTAMIARNYVPSIRDVDPAMIRPGRCFDIVKFDTLSKDQATVLADKLNIQLASDRETYTIGEIFHDLNAAPVQSFGFNH